MGNFSMAILVYCMGIWILKNTQKSSDPERTQLITSTSGETPPWIGGEDGR